MGKKGGTMIQGQNQFKFSYSNSEKQISWTFFLFHQNIDWEGGGIDMDIFLFWCQIGAVSIS